MFIKLCHSLLIAQHLIGLRNKCQAVEFSNLKRQDKGVVINFHLKKLDDLASAMSDNESADYLQQQRGLLFKQINEDCRKSA